VRCILVVDGDRAVGAGAHGLSTPHVARQRGFGTNHIGFTAVAPAGGEAYRVVAVVGPDHSLVMLPGGLKAVDAPVHPSARSADDLADDSELDGQAPEDPPADDGEAPVDEVPVTD
jgi:hypothetical protein